ncbi:hypothetical protein [Planctomycetes bacterium K23_9]|uniref:Uncharacterized protein n=1 Tax=Stieleria marina TaxID=1930275 RepID=A0A517NTN2_9BACT|nr:hypothetical protein K239x_24430 [Planctomycetes bacterium K23_9]
MSTYPSDQVTSVGLDPVTARTLQKFGQRRKVLLVLRAIAGGIVVFVAAMLLIALCDYFWILPDSVRVLLSVVGYSATIAAMWFFGFGGLRDTEATSLAVHMQSTTPRLRDDLLSAVELADPNEANGSADFRERLQKRVARRVALLNVADLLPMALIRKWLSAGLTIAAVCLVLLLIPQMQFGRRFARAMLPGAPIERASKTKIAIIQPSPASGYVAEGDAVGIVIEITGEITDEVLLVWQSDDGMSGESMMSPRAKPATANSAASIANRNTSEETNPNSSQTTIETSDHFAANLSVGKSPIEYQIFAGDAISLWHRLTPLPRPRVGLFQKRYQFPSYAKLAERTEEDEHGDLKALTGTTAELTIQFDEPVRDAKIRFANEGGEIELFQADESKNMFTASIPIKTAGQYQVDAVSIKSGLNNPFSPTYTIVPVIDTPPVAKWADTVTDMMIVSPLAVLDLAGSVQDDLPVDKIIQEITINSITSETFEIPVPSPSRDAQPSWQWDLLKRTGGNKETPKLSSGDIVRTRLVAIDRRGLRGESRIVDLLIADEGFDDDRHRKLDEWSELTTEVLAWTKSAAAVGDTIKELGRTPDAAEINSLRQLYAELNERTSSVLQSLANSIEITDQVTDTNSLELMGRAIIAMDGELKYSVEELAHALSIESDLWKTAQAKIAKSVSNHGTRLSHQAMRINTLARAIVSHELSLAVTRDASALQSSLQPMTNEASGLPADRFDRYLKVTLARMKAIDELIRKHDAVLMDSSRAHFAGESWRRWAERWSLLINRIKDDESEKNQRDLIRRFEGELKKKSATGMADGRLMQLFNESYRDIRREMRSYADLIRQIQRSGREAVRQQERSEKEDDADKAALANWEAQAAESNYIHRIGQAAQRLTAESELHRRRPRVDLKHAADLTLLRRAIEHVNENGFADYKDESPTEVHENLSGAIRVLESVHEAELAQSELKQLLVSEQSLSNSADDRLSSGIWIHRYSLAAEWSIKQWQESKLDWPTLIDPMDRTRYDKDFSAARDRLTRRRWDQKEPVSAEVSLNKLTQRVDAGLQNLQPHVIAARATIQRYVLSLPEQARQAAEKATEAEQRTDQRQDSQSETAEQLAAQQEEAETAAEQTVQALIDKANTSDMLDDEQREIARDADAAASAINDASEQAKEAMQDAKDAANEQQRDAALEKAEESLSQLASTLEKTAEHFDKLERGENADQSREELRKTEEELQIARDLEQRYEEAKAMADAANSDPEELLKKLEAELKKNEPMQQELSEISENAAQSAQKTLEQAESDERQLNQALERSDAAVQEAKRRAAKKLEELSRRLESTSNHLLGMAQEASGWANEPKTRDKFTEAREALKKAVDESRQMGGESALAEQMKKTVQNAKQSVSQAAEAIKKAKQESAEASQRDVHQNEPARKSAQSKMESKARNTRNRIVQDMNRERAQWSREEQEANRRVQQAQRQERDARDQRQRAEDRLKKADPKKTDQKQRDQLQSQIDQQKQREANADKAEQAADQTRDYAKDQRKEIEQAIREAQKEKLERLTRPNPAGQLAEETAQQATKTLDDLQQQLDAIAKQLGGRPELSTPTDKAQSLSEQQDRINSDVKNAADQVARAARHEERLGQKANAEGLEQAAESIQENGLKAGQDAKQSLDQAAKEAKETPQAGQQVADAEQKIGQDAERLAQMLQSTSDSESPDSDNPGDKAAESSSDKNQASSPKQSSQGQPSSASADKAKKMAQTLDELDRAIAEANDPAQQKKQPSEQQQGDEPQGQQPQGQEQGQPKPGQDPGSQKPGEQKPGSQPGKQTAGQASPTLSQMLDSQSQQAAKDRQQTLQPGKNSEASKQQGEVESGEKEGDQLTQNSGPGDPPGGGEGILGQVDMSELGDWGSLRQRKTDDASESRESRVAPQYRREVEAYFRAVARRAAAKANATEKSK